MHRTCCRPMIRRPDWSWLSRTALRAIRCRRQRRRRLTAPLRLLRGLVGHKMGMVFLALVAVLAAGFALLERCGGRRRRQLGLPDLLDAAGAAVTSTTLPSPEKGAQFLLTFDGMAFLPFVTAAIVSSRIPGSPRPRPAPR